MRDFPTADEIAEMPGLLVRRCNQVFMGIFLEETNGHDLSPIQYGALVIINNEPGIDQTRLMQRLALDRSSVTKCVERLEDRCLITRDVDRNDRRVRHLNIAEDGLVLLERIGDGVRHAQERLLAPLGADRRRHFLDMLKEVVDAHNETSRVPMRPAED